MNSNSKLTLLPENANHNSPKNQLEAFLYYMAKLDTGMLSEILEDSRTYQDADKELFIERLTEALEKFKDLGKDTVLEAIPGECGNESCNKGCRGYAFTGNSSGLHLDLIVENSNARIIDIYHCSYFKADAAELDIDKSISIDIYPDEEADFKPSEEYLMTLHRYNNACDEILKKEKSVLDLNFAEKWLEKHKELIQTFDIF